METIYICPNCSYRDIPERNHARVCPKCGTPMKVQYEDTDKATTWAGIKAHYQRYQRRADPDDRMPLEDFIEDHPELLAGTGFHYDADRGTLVRDTENC